MTATGRGRSGKFLMRYWVSVSTSSLGMGTSKLSIMRMTVCQPSGVYPARARLMSWQAPHKLTNVCLPGPSAKSACACCAYAGAVVQKRVAAIAAKSGCLDMLPSPQTLLCASLPQFLGCKPRTLREGGELHPHDLGVDLQPAGKGAEAAIDAGDDALGSHHARVLHDAVGHQLGVLDEVRGGIDDARDDDLAVG